MDAKAAWSEHREVLCVRLDTIGDVLMTTPAIRALRAQGPERRITLLTSPSGAEIAGLVPEIDAVIAYEAPWMKPAPTDPSPRGDCAMVERLRAGAFDAAAIFTTFSQSALPAALTCHLAGIPHRLAHSREKPYHLLTEWVPEPEPAGVASPAVRHEVQRHLDMVATVGATTDRTGLSLAVPPEATSAALACLREAGHDPDEPWLVVHPGSTAQSRRYPVDLYAKATARLAAASGRRIVVTGDRSERELAEELRTRVGAAAVSLAGRLSLPQLAGLIAAAPLLVSNNTGPVHMAAAVGTPTVVLYALTNPQHTPWQVPSRILNHDVPCRWCFSSVCLEGHHACLRMVPPADVAEAALALLADGPRVSSEPPRAAAAG
jgi:lipopolysaccharide heptosyltransferase II